MQQGHPQIVTQVISTRIIGNGQNLISNFMLGILREVNSSFFHTNFLARGITETIQATNHTLSLRNRSLTEENDIVSKEEM